MRYSQYLRKKKEALASLGKWKHINCLLSAKHADVRDDVLREILFAPDKKTTKGKEISLLDALDLDNIAALGGIRTVRDLPGGSVSFLFERSSEDKVLVPEEETEVVVQSEPMDFDDIIEDDSDVDFPDM